MNNPFASPDQPFGVRPGFGFGPGPAQRRALHSARRHARREFFEHLRDHAGDDVPFGFGPGVGPGFGFGFGFGPGGPRGGWRRGGPGRGRRGDVRAAILVLLGEGPMHGYEMIQQIAERSNGLWRPSPGSVYPTLQLLDDEGLVTAGASDGSKKLFELTDEGRAAAEKIETPPWEEIAEGVAPGHINLRKAMGQLFGAVMQSAHTASAEQQQRIVDIINNARREIYGVLGED
ncbi:transcriptional regulator PadR-like family protein [Mycobacterium kansasii 732]|uniref:Transcriptional regulator YqjI n=1 Tax=Mycobacterium pseudokansasii TaxID=2341080 RepID=A0A498QYS9_9MYCO|nr:MULTISPECIES: PadR family transcriptional regulator [Mycobacterium]EUA05877.1 transcriptional regulator PadR-like family protein [Mycobacterium kansasii 732]KZS60781.1 PadR family transcriptional regulator [Mycobacterium kansasii]MBY0391337.1 PadR family transcriptional regulator [Mycobacterium pseudokansasii]ORC11543.1 transcriptional regulator [Mycobacterium kansasii]POX92650.1 PadR family transcriptional regulator [Mycobacterium kansasii]